MFILDVDYTYTYSPWVLQLSSWDSWYSSSVCRTLLSQFRFLNITLVKLTGVTRYFTVQAALTKGFFPVARFVTALMTLALTVLTFLTFGILLAGKLGPREVP